MISERNNVGTKNGMHSVGTLKLFYFGGTGSLLSSISLISLILAVHYPSVHSAQAVMPPFLHPSSRVMKVVGTVQKGEEIGSPFASG